MSALHPESHKRNCESGACREKKSVTFSTASTLTPFADMWCECPRIFTVNESCLNVIDLGRSRMKLNREDKSNRSERLLGWFGPARSMFEQFLSLSSPLRVPKIQLLYKERIWTVEVSYSCTLFLKHDFRHAQQSNNRNHIPVVRKLLFKRFLDLVCQSVVLVSCRR